jgi:hypothetical protein
MYAIIRFIENLIISKLKPEHINFIESYFLTPLLNIFKADKELVKKIFLDIIPTSTPSSHGCTLLERIQTEPLHSTFTIFQTYITILEI